MLKLAGNRTWQCHAGNEGSDVCVAQAGARGVAVSSHRYAQPYEFAYDHVSGQHGTQDDLFMSEPAASCLRSCDVPTCLVAAV